MRDERRVIYKAKKSDYPAYAEMYMKLLPDDGKILFHLEKNFNEVKQFVEALPADILTYRYSPEKWTIKEILCHIIDDERIFSYRALCFARNEKQNLPGFDQDAYVIESDANSRNMESIVEEYYFVRMATIALFKHLPEKSLDRMGHGSGSFNDASARALIYHIAGHEQHHIHIIKERYLSQKKTEDKRTSL